MVGDCVAVVVIQDASNIGIFFANTEDGRCVEFAGVFIEGIAVLDPRLRAIIIVTHLEVHDTRYGVRAIGGGRAVFQNFDALNGSLGNRIQIDKHHIHQAWVVARGIDSDPSPVQQDESRSRIETAESNRRSTYSGVGAVFIIRSWNYVGVSDGEALQKLLRGKLT